MDADGRMMGRRAFLSGSAVAALGIALGRVPTAFASGADFDAFMHLSRTASGVANLSRTLGHAYFAALETDGVLKLKPSQFARLAGISGNGGPSTIAALERTSAYRAPGGKECLAAVAAAWWSGFVPIPGGGQRVVTFGEALVWREVHEPMTCQGLTGVWAKPGRGVV